MSITNDIKKLLDIQDVNITFEENVVQTKEIKGKKVKLISVQLTYTPAHCEKCGVKNEDNSAYKNGTKTSRITLPIECILKWY